MVVLAVVYMFNFVDRQILAIVLPAIRGEKMDAITTASTISHPISTIHEPTGPRSGGGGWEKTV